MPDASSIREESGNYLGLKVDRTNKRISREDTPNGKDLDLSRAKLEWLTFILAYDAGEKGVERVRWKNAYRQLEGDIDGRGPDQAKARLRRKLEETLQVTITNGKGRFIKLIPLDTPPQPRRNVT